MATMEPIAGETKKRVVSPTPVPTCACSCGQILTYGGQPSSATSLTLISVASITDRDTRTHLVHTISRSWLLHALRQQDEAHARTDDSRIGHELWSLQEDGNLRASRRLPLRTPVSDIAILNCPFPCGHVVFLHRYREQNLPQSEK